MGKRPSRVCGTSNDLNSAHAHCAATGCRAGRARAAGALRELAGVVVGGPTAVELRRTRHAVVGGLGPDRARPRTRRIAARPMVVEGRAKCGVAVGERRRSAF